MGQIKRVGAIPSPHVENVSAGRNNSACHISTEHSEGEIINLSTIINNNKIKKPKI